MSQTAEAVHAEIDLNTIARTAVGRAAMPERYRADALSAARLSILRARRSVDASRSIEEQAVFFATAAIRGVWTFASREHRRDRRTFYPDHVAETDGEDASAGMDAVRVRPRRSRHADGRERAARLLELLPRCVVSTDEREIIEARMNGRSVNEIAADRGVSRQTIANRLHDIFERMRFAEFETFILGPKETDRRREVESSRCAAARLQ